ncbi:MAG TPA: helix-turn-helix domain-containing protein, partial [Blastocatellia bacterium]|nr:helix-turn-helix domain-containing protein [Blastocatellia bacterium]
MNTETAFLSTTETGERLGITRQRVLQLIESGALPATKVGSAFIIRADDLTLVADRKPGRPARAATEGEATTTGAVPNSHGSATTGKPKKAEAKKARKAGSKTTT